MEDFVQDFVAETVEALGALDNDLLRLEVGAAEPDLVPRIFRAVHTIKGTCGFLGLNRLRRVAHSAENVLDAIRKDRLAAGTEVVTAILGAIDVLKAITDHLGATGSEGEGDDEALINRLDALHEGASATPAPPPPPAATLSAEEAALAAAWDATPAHIPIPEPVPAPAPAPAPILAPAAVPAPRAEARPVAAGEGAAQSIRVNLDLLETLMTSVSELVLTRNQLLQLSRNSRDNSFAGPLQRLNHVVSELQENVMKTRMQPVGNAWSKLPRIVRDLARDLDKKIEMRMTGAETELDRQVLEMIRDPLTHMVRNSCDHGLERPAERVAAGKDETGIIALHASHEGGHIVMTLSDDGRGLNLVRIRQKAVERGLATEAEVAAMGDNQVAQFIFRSGFSTAAAVTDVSGRGVGMDVVRTNVERIGGTIELSTKPGKGSVFTIKIPLTLAIVSALIVDCAGQRYAVPQISVTEMVQAGEGGERRIERIRDTPVLRLRDRLLPLVPLRSVLGLPRGEPGKEGSLVIVTRVGAYEFGIVVDSAQDTEEIVVKPVAPLLKEIGVYSGNTILGDGSVCMIVDPNGILARAGRLDTSAGGDGVQAAAGAEGLHGSERVALLLVRAGLGMPKAIPLDLVARLEEIAVDEIHELGGRMLTKYRGKLMPLIAADHGVAFEPGTRKPVLVFAEGENSMGLVVDTIDDIVESDINVELRSGRPEAIGSALVGGRPVELLNASHFVGETAGTWFSPPSVARRPRGRRVLMVDDSPFFRGLVGPIIRSCGLEVLATGSAEEALARLEAGERADLVVTDIEMPGMDGYELCRTLKRDPRWAHLPVIGLSGHAGAEDVERGMAAGFARHLPKLARDDISRAIGEVLQPETCA
ncbi:hybrid sensor histidine kinase/response regulator [Paracraurococcus ruber]|uniref:histidine kinase n=1 Tax=Paracraurococcus ruber TaxID=77675 RepID=A0ABS1CQC8_9PROT|nr:hybrid sensor histidine kinase/response regulator [Paracraurococcus ruber]MBK1656618.1 hybrid sensor histidine kinase/response regulator [Paracraurococcus ruber]TDG33757.1 hybrid sensor histidine kinase/response regulator [Paracraurococcus ruber]